VRSLGRRPRSASSHRRARSTDDLRGKLRALRTAQGLTLEDLAPTVGLSKSALSQIESGRIDPSQETLPRLVQALKVTLASLFETRAAVDHPGRAPRSAEGLPHPAQPASLRAPEPRSRGQARRVPARGARSREGREAPALRARGRGVRHRDPRGVEVFVEGSIYALGPGDSIFFHATAPHDVVNAGRRTAVTIWAIAPSTY
jgi:transcriptional regulator with XRE-family HTH domain